MVGLDAENILEDGHINTVSDIYRSVRNANGGYSKLKALQLWLGGADPETIIEELEMSEGTRAPTIEAWADEWKDVRLVDPFNRDTPYTEALFEGIDSFAEDRYDYFSLLEKEIYGNLPERAAKEVGGGEEVSESVENHLRDEGVVESIGEPEENPFAGEVSYEEVGEYFKVLTLQDKEASRDNHSKPLRTFLLMDTMNSDCVSYESLGDILDVTPSNIGNWISSGDYSMKSAGLIENGKGDYEMTERGEQVRDMVFDHYESFRKVSEWLERSSYSSKS